MANGARSPPWTPPGSGELSREGSLAFSSGLPHPHSTAPRRAEAYFSILKEWRRTQALRQRPALPVTPVGGSSPLARTVYLRLPKYKHVQISCPTHQTARRGLQLLTYLLTQQNSPSTAEPGPP